MPLSAVHVGRLFEATMLKRLAHEGCTLAPLGGAFDQCVDLAGVWLPPLHPVPPWPGDAVQLLCSPLPPAVGLPLVVQCKATRSAAGVATLREFVHAVSSRFPANTLAVLACTGGFAWRSLRREREWATRDVLLLHTTPGGGLLGLMHLRAMGGVERLPTAFSSRPLA